MAGVLYLVNIVCGAYAIGIVPTLTGHDIQAHELVYRSGILAHLLVTVTNVPMAVLFFYLLRVVNRKLALLDAFFTLVGTAIEAASLLAGTPGSVQADYDIYTVFYGFDILCVAYLVYRSGFLPRIIGVLLAIDGVAYLVHSVTDILAPAAATHLAFWTNLAPPLGEGSLCLWLIVVGVNAKRWFQALDAQAAAADEFPDGVLAGRGATRP